MSRAIVVTSVCSSFAPVESTHAGALLLEASCSRGRRLAELRLPLRRVCVLADTQRMSGWRVCEACSAQ